MRRPTMRDVARAAGVSPATVSRVVNNDRYIRNETRTAVRQAIAALGFQRNEAARALRPGQSSDTIGLVVDDVASPFWSAIVRGVEEVAHRNNSMVMVGSTGDSDDREHGLARDLVMRRRVDGLLVAPTTRSSPELHEELGSWVPMVFLGRAPGRLSADTVALDNQGGARDAVEHLVARDHRRIGYIGAGQPVGASRLAGYRQALENAVLRYEPDLVHTNISTADAAFATARELLSGPVPADAIFADDTRVSVGVLRAVHRYGNNVGAAAFGDLELADLMPGPVALVTYNATKLGADAAELLFARMRGASGPRHHVIHRTTLVTLAGAL
jgi:LacI family transcriptional regulator